MTTLAQFLETGELRVVIDRTFPLSQASEALRYLLSGQPVGRVVVVVSDFPRRPDRIPLASPNR